MKRKKNHYPKNTPAAAGGMPVAHYDAGGAGRRISTWRPPSSGPNATLSNIQTIRNRQRDAERNDWQAANSVRVQGTNLIGTGIVARMVKGEKSLRDRANESWNEFIRYSDADGVLNFYGQQLLGTRSLAGAGEVFLRFRYRRPQDGLRTPLQIQLYEPDMVPMLDTTNWTGLPRGNVIRSGIELDYIGRRVAYWMWRYHPGEHAAQPQPNDLIRVPASLIRPVYEPKRPGQLRGVSEFAPVIAKLRSIGNFDDAVLHRQEIANLFTMFHIRPAPGGDPAVNPMTGQEIRAYSSGSLPLATMEPATSQELFPGEDVKFSDPPDAGTNYAEYMREQNIGVAAGGGQPYELLTGDIREVSDRTLRVIINEYRRRCEQQQWLILIPQLCQPVRDAWADSATLTGEFTAEENALIKQVVWQPQGWPYIHPVQDAQGEKIKIEMGVKSEEAVITERGDDPEEIEEQMKRDNERRTRLGRPRLDSAKQQTA